MKDMKKNKFPAIRLLGDRVLVRSFESSTESKTAAGLILPGKENGEKQERGEVIAVGPGRLTSEGKRLPLEIKAKDIVIFKRDYSADPITLDKEEYVLLSEGSILAIEG